ncbi:MAG: hypothetical protein M3295_09610 [Chloroflexota bacterium]|nr:hypothetical protein [Chloroflexota bacterium]
MCAIVRDLMFAARIVDAADRAGAALQTVSAPDRLPPAGEVDLLLVDWNDRAGDWADRIRAWLDARAPDRPRPRVVLFGSHTDLEGHADARRRGIGPVLARSRFVHQLPEILR